MDTQRENGKLRTILEITRRMGVTADLDQLLPIIVEAACEVLECERATIFLYDRDRDELISRVARDCEPIRLPAGRGVAGAAARSGACVNVPDAYADPRFDASFDRRSGFVTRSLLALPMENLDGELIGVLQAINKHDGPFTRDDEQLAALLAAQAGVALDRARLIEAYAEKQRMARDLALAREIQQAQFPHAPPQVESYAIAGWNRPADETGGDCYDLWMRPDGRVLVVLADATGHGIPAALIIAQFRSLVRALVSVTDDLEQIARSVNALLCSDLDGRLFVTALIGLLDPASHRFEYIAAGQGPLVHVHDARPRVRVASTIPLGIIDPLPRPSPQCFTLAPGDLLALLTDGFYEAARTDGEEFGLDRVLASLLEQPSATPESLLARLAQAVDDFLTGAKQTDDLTGVLIRRQR